jgi:hypothetical protein
LGCSAVLAGLTCAVGTGVDGARGERAAVEVRLARQEKGGRASWSGVGGRLTDSPAFAAGGCGCTPTCSGFSASLCPVTCSAGLDSCSALSLVDVLFTSSGRGAAVAFSAGPSDGVRKPSFKISTSSGDRARRLEGVGGSSLILQRQVILGCPRERMMTLSPGIRELKVGNHLPHSL